jgi:hypothetical protein
MSAGSPAPQAPDCNSICSETLERLGELRPDRTNNPKYVRSTIWLYAPLFGGLGVLFGYALYFQIEPLIHDQDRQAAGSLIIGLMAAVVETAPMPLPSTEATPPTTSSPTL